MRLLRKIIHDTRGVAAVELGLIAPVIATLGLISFQVWDSAARIEDMRTGLKAGAQYLMNGGTSDPTAQTIALSSWENKPADGAVQVSRACFCAEDPQICANACGNGNLPSVFVTLAATASRPGAMFGASLSDQSVVRVR